MWGWVWKEIIRGKSNGSDDPMMWAINSNLYMSELSTAFYKNTGAPIHEILRKSGIGVKPGVCIFTSHRSGWLGARTGKALRQGHRKPETGREGRKTAFLLNRMQYGYSTNERRRGELPGMQGIPSSVVAGRMDLAGQSKSREQKFM